MHVEIKALRRIKQNKTKDFDFRGFLFCQRNYEQSVFLLSDEKHILVFRINPRKQLIGRNTGQGLNSVHKTMTFNILYLENFFCQINELKVQIFVCKINCQTVSQVASVKSRW